MNQIEAANRMQFKKLPVENLDHLRREVRRIQKQDLGRGFIFRGMWAEHPLATTLERACVTASIRSKDVPDFERLIIREFKRRYHHYSAHVPAPDLEIEWRALMQHYGAPTRLLDWTYSLEAAIYFALKSSRDRTKGDAAVWMMDHTWAADETFKTFMRSRKRRRSKPLVDAMWKPDDEIAFSKALLARPAVKCVCPVNPYRLNERLTIQKGVFLWTMNVTESFEANLKAMSGFHLKDRVIVFHVPRGQIQPGLSELYNANISDATLFPGLDGFARSLDINLASAPALRKGT